MVEGGIGLEYVLIVILHKYSAITYVYLLRCAKRTTREISVSFLELSVVWNSDATRQQKMRQTNSRYIYSVVGQTPLPVPLVPG